ncbi:hypothetical protein FS749_016657 [Ceratobasidium sp. UAMH 11750]|nr:hypothetical protein FS749_016657 [Ceratobasidium sp. UAMH 11750]
MSGLEEDPEAGWIYHLSQVTNPGDNPPQAASQVVAPQPVAHEWRPASTQPTYFAAGPPQHSLGYTQSVCITLFPGIVNTTDMPEEFQPTSEPALAQPAVMQPTPQPMLAQPVIMQSTPQLPAPIQPQSFRPTSAQPMPVQSTQVPGPSTHPLAAQLPVMQPQIQSISQESSRPRKRRRQGSPFAFDPRLNNSTTAPPPTRAGALANNSSQNPAISALGEAIRQMTEIPTQRLAKPRTPEARPRTVGTVATVAAQGARDHTNEDVDQLAVMDEIYSNGSEEKSSENWTRMYQLIDRLLAKQDEMSKTIERLQERGPNRMHFSEPTQENSAYTSPPEPPKDPVWDQTVTCTLPAGRRARAARHTQILAMIREVMLKLLKIPPLKKGGTLPPPPPPAVRVPTRDQFSLRWDETEKSQFNKIAAGILVQEISDNPPLVLTDSEIQQLPKMVQQHIRYLCRRYKNKNRADTEEFNARRLKNCSADSRKRRYRSESIDNLWFTLAFQA